LGDNKASNLTVNAQAATAFECITLNRVNLLAGTGMMTGQANFKDDSKIRKKINLKETK
jgi:hypothetical protein